MKLINFLITFFLLSILCFVSFVIAYAFDEGTLGNDQLGLIGTYVLKIFYFPSIFFFIKWLRIETVNKLYIIGLLVDITIWTFVFQLIFYHFRKTKN